jgi:maleate isomerase
LKTAGTYDYGRQGRLGIGVPQANPTVEAEFAILAPPGVSVHVARLTSAKADGGERVRDYLEHVEDALGAYDQLKPDLFGFACTASSYLVSPAREAELIEGAQTRFGYPILTATGAIAWSLAELGVRRLAMISPYPPNLLAASCAYWTQRGFDLVQVARVQTAAPDTRSIYALSSADGAAALGAIDPEVDAVLISGTGMPSLPLIRLGAAGPPVLSSNFCLAAQMFARLGLGDLLDARSRASQAWRARLIAATAPTQTICTP